MGKIYYSKPKFKDNWETKQNIKHTAKNFPGFKTPFNVAFLSSNKDELNTVGAQYMGHNWMHTA